MKKLKLVAVGMSMCPDFEAMSAGRRSFIGRRLDPEQGEFFTDRESGLQMRNAVFVPLEDEVAIVEKPWPNPHWKEYREELLAGCLLPGDEDTAKEAGLKFDPSFKGSAADHVGPRDHQS